MSKAKNSMFRRLLAVVLVVMMLVSSYSTAILSVTAASTDTESVSDNDKGKTVTFVVNTTNKDYPDYYVYVWCGNSSNTKFYSEISKRATATLGENTYTLLEFPIPSDATGCILTTEKSGKYEAKLTPNVKFNTSGNKTHFFLNVNGNVGNNQIDSENYKDITITTNSERLYERAVGDTIQLEDMDKSKWGISGSLSKFITSYEFVENDEVLNENDTEPFVYEAKESGRHTISLKAKDIFGYSNDTNVEYTVIARENRSSFSFANATETVIIGTNNNEIDIQPLEASYDGVTYESSNPNVAEISGDKIKIKKIGSVTITARAGKTDHYFESEPAKYTLVINKQPEVIEGLSFEYNGIQTVTFDQVYNNTVKNQPDGATVVYTSSNTAIAEVNKYGKIIQKRVTNAGEVVTITATVSAPGYITKSISYDLVITKAEMNVQSEINKQFKFSIKKEYDCGKCIADLNTIPEGSTVTYSWLQGKKENVIWHEDTKILEFLKPAYVEIQATISADNYVDKTIILKIKAAKDVVAKEDFKFDKNEIKVTYGENGNNLQLNLIKPEGVTSVEYQIVEEDNANGTATVNKDGLVSVLKSGTIKVVAAVKDDPYYENTKEEDKAVCTIKIEKGVLNNWSYEVKEAEIYLGQPYKIVYPILNFDGNAGYAVNGPEFIQHSENRNIIIPKAEGTYEIVVTAYGDDRYFEKSDTITLTVKKLEADNTFYSLEGNRVAEGKNDFNSAVTVKAKENYKIALYDESVDYFTFTDWKDSIVINYNISNPKFVVKSYADNDTNGAISDAIESDIKVDKVAPTGNIKVETNFFDDLFEAITFGYYKAHPDVTITMDESSEDFDSDSKIEYYIAKDSESAEILTPEELKNVEWKTYTEPFKLKYNNSIVYAKFSDAFGNATYISSDNVVVDGVDPVVVSEIKTEMNVFGYYNSDLEVDINVSDTGATDDTFSSGIDFNKATVEIFTEKGKTNYRGTFDKLNTTLTIPFSELSKGEQVYYVVTVYDKSGNSGAYISEKFKVANLPEVSLELDNKVVKPYYVKNDKVVLNFVIDQDEFVFDEAKANELFNSVFEDYDDISITDWSYDSRTGKHTRTATLTNVDNTYNFNRFINKDDYKYQGQPIKVTAGTESNYDFVVDTANPNVKFTSDVTESKEYEGKYYFNKNRVITITVIDNNFIGNDKMINVEVVNSSDIHPGVVWNGNVGTIEFVEDAEYKITINENEFKDKAGNKLEDVTVPKDMANFVIDSVAPKITMSFDNNTSAVGGYYYQEPRTATINVEDADFVGTTDMIKVVAKDVTGKEIKAPSIVWEGNIGTVSFVDDANYTVEVSDEITDLAGNPAEIILADSSKDAEKFAVDKTPPVNLSVRYREDSDTFWGTLAEFVEKLTGGLVYFDEKVIVEVSATDLTSGIDAITYSAPVSEDNTANGVAGVEEKTVKNVGENNATFSTVFEISPEYVGKVEATVVDRAGYSVNTDESGIVVSDSTPDITLEVLNEDAANEYKGIGDNNLYFNEDVEISVSVDDTFFDSSKVVITETTDGKTNSIVPTDWVRIAETNTYTTTVKLTSDGVKRLDVAYTNNSGNSAESKFVENIVIDKTAPKATISYDNNTSAVGGYYYQDSRTATIVVEDVNFRGIETMMSVKARDVLSNSLTAPVLSWNEKTGTINFTDDAHYEVEVTPAFMDLAGNTAKVTVDDSTKDAYKFAVDKSESSDLKIEYKGKSEAEWKQLSEFDKTFKDGYYYFGESIDVKISAGDITSGIKTITYSAPSTTDSSGVNSIAEQTVTNNNENSSTFVAEFEIPAEFMGKVEATVVDRAGRTTDSDEAYGIVVSEKKPEITLDVTNKDDAVKHGDISYYNEDVVIKVTVEDTFFDSSKVVITETTDGKTADLEVKEWKREGDSNVYSTIIKFKTDGVKRLDVAYANNSKHSAESKLVENIVVDKIPAKATIKYDNNYSSVNGYYYQNVRTATITVDDVNFVGTTDMFKVVAKDVTGKELTAPSVVWNGKVGTIEFTEDAQYTVDITDKFTDLAGTPVEVTIDGSTKDAYSFAVDKSNPADLTIKYRKVSDTFWGTLADFVEKLTGGLIYFDESLEVEISANDITSGVDTITYSAPVSDDNTAVDVNGVDTVTVTNEDKTSSEFVTKFIIPAEYKGKVEATVVDRAGRFTTSNEEFNIVVSEKKPVISIEVMNKADAVIHNNAKTQKNVAYFNEDVVVNVTVEDTFFDSSKVVIRERTDSMDEVLNNENLVWTRHAGTNKYTTTINLAKQGVKSLEASYTNNSGRSAETKHISEIVIDKTAPKVVISYDNNTSLVGGYFYDKARTSTVSVDDVNFIGTTEMMTVTAVDKAEKSIENVPQISWNEKTGTINFTDDAYYTLAVEDKFVDLAGNKAVVTVDSETVDAYSFVVDKSEPDFGKITVKSDSSKQIDVSETVHAHDTIKYSNELVNISIESNDVLTDCKVEYYVSSKYLNCKDITAWDKYTGTVKLTPDCKFVLYTKITDEAGNYIYRTTNIIILDRTNPEIDGVSPDIKLNPSSNKQKIDKNGDVLYNGDVVVDFEITDPVVNNSCSGLKTDKLTYQVLCDGVETQSGVLKGTATAFENRIGKYSGSITIDAERNNSNNVELIVKAYDNADNSGSKTAKLRIDITAPTISVRFDKQPDADNVKYFKDSRVGTITITERNFDEKDVVVKMTKNGQAFNPDLNWSSSGTPQTDSYTHTATFTLAQDGDYTFDISYVDEATNKAGAANYGNSVSPREFTVDRTKPEVSISFDNNSVQNGNYYRAHRVATITVNEHNFDPSRFDFSCTATNDGANATAPSLSSWSNSGDTHTATVNFNTDSKFTLQVAYTDMAGNVADEVPREEFYVDTTAPEITISGINDHSANNGKDGDIGFVITATDININSGTFNPAFVKVDMNGKNESKFDLGSNSSINNGVVYTVNNISDDGIYTVSCEVSDMAGNVTRTAFVQNEAGKKEELAETLFSVNRQGSTFMLDEETRKLVDLGYIQNVEKDIVITEINPDEVEKYVVTLEKGSGDTKILSYGENYTRQDNVSEGSWKTYSYVVKASNFSEESAYSLAISTTDKASNTSYSETKNPSYTDEPLAKVKFIVDRTIPEVVVTNLESNGHYNVEKQVVDIVANDDNLLTAVKIVLNDEVIKEYTEEQLAENGGKMTLEINSLQSLQDLEIIAVDAANNSTNDTEDTQVVFENFLITTNLWIQFINSPIAIIIAVSAIVLVGGLIVFIVAKKRSKKEEE